MKKSSFLHNPKDMLSKTFKPAKCKIALKLATSRMKLLKNKKDVQLKQMKRELSQLLESGQDQTARIRVEHVIREEKMMAAYELLDIYCELIVARLPIIESQKGCPIDLKEAITSVIFASPRCGDVPELLDARKHFSAKYGKEFVSAAVELRPNSGVSRLLVEKLSASAPDGQTKIKALTKIAEEHNIKWDPNSFGQSDMPSDDLLNGPKAFEKASTVIPEDPPKVTPNFQSPPSHYTNQPSNFSQQNVRSSPGNENFSPRHSSMSSNTTSSIPHTQMRPSEVGQEQGQVSQSFQGEGSSSFSGQSWSMEFKDATSAAKAAAESAERASMAARAAAELSSRVQTARQPQYSSEAHNSIGDVNRDERTAKQATPKHTSDYLPQDSAKSSLSDRQPRFQNKPTDRIEQENRERLSEQSYKDGLDRGKGYGHISSSRSKASVQDETFARSVQVPDGYSRKSLSKDEVNKVESSMQRQSGKSETEGMNHLREGFRSEKFDYSGEEMIRKQPSILSSISNSGISDSDDDFSNSGQQKFGHDAGKGWVVGNDEEQNARENLSSSYHGAGAAPPVVFDDSGSDGEDIGSNIGFKLNEESNFHFASPGRNSPSNLPTNTGNGSLTYRTGKSSERAISEVSTKKHSFTEISESLEQPMDGPQEDNFGPVTFDDSDGESSEVEIDMPHSEHTRTEDSRDPLTRQNQSLEVSDSETHRNYSQKTEIVVESSKKFSFGESPISQSSLRLGKSQRESDSADSNSSFYNSVDEAEYLGSSQSKVSFVHEVKDNISSAYLHGTQMDDENLDDGKQLNFKKLTGGFRQKGYSHSPYTRSQLDGTSSSSKGVSEDVPTTIRQSADASTVESYTNNRKSKHIGDGRISKVSNYYSDSDSDSSLEKLEKQPASLRLKSDNEDVGKDVKIQTSLRGSATHFDSKSSDSEDDSGKQVVTGKNRLGSGFSRRTKPSSSSSTSVSKQKAGSSSRVHVNSDSGSEGTPTTRSYGAETPQEPVSWNRNSDLQRKSEQPGSAKVASKANFETAQEPVSWNRNSDLQRKSEQPGSAKIASKGKLETAQDPASWNRNSDLQRKSEQPGSAKIASKANFETDQEPASWNRNSDLQRKSEQPGSAKIASKANFETDQEPASWNRNSDLQRKSGQPGSAKIASKANFETAQEPVSWNRNSDLQQKSEQPGSAKIASKANFETAQEPVSWNRNSDLQRKSEQPGSAKVASKAKLETPQEPASWNRNSDLQRKSEQPGSAKVASKANLVSHVSLPEKNLNTSVVAPPASTERKAEKSENPENQKAPSGTTIGREDSSKKASHVHPKLPDYDTLAAKLQALRTDRR